MLHVEVIMLLSKIENYLGRSYQTTILTTSVFRLFRFVYLFSLAGFLTNAETIAY